MRLPVRSSNEFVMTNDQQRWSPRRPRTLAISTLPSFYPPNWSLPLPPIYHPNLGPNHIPLPSVFSDLRSLSMPDPDPQYNFMAYPNSIQPHNHMTDISAHSSLPGHAIADEQAMRTEDNSGDQQLPVDDWTYPTATNPVPAGAAVHSGNPEFIHSNLNSRMPPYSYMPELHSTPTPMPSTWSQAMRWQNTITAPHQPRHPVYTPWYRDTIPLSTSDRPETHQSNASRLQPYQHGREASNPVRLTPDEVLQAGRRIAIPISQKSRSRKHRKPKVPPKETCVACMEQSDAHLIITLRCGCKYDHECLEGLFKAGCTSTLAFPPTCHGLPLRLNVYGSLLSKTIIKRYKEVEAEKNTKEFFYCALPTCSESLTMNAKMSVKDYSYRDCHKCGESTCEKCRMLTRDHKTNKVSKRVKCRAEPAEMVAFRKLSKKYQWKQCPSCGHFIEKDEGCDHIECPCGIEFCYKCGGLFDENDNCQCTPPSDSEDDTTSEIDWPDHRAAVDRVGRQVCNHRHASEIDGLRCHGCLKVSGDHHVMYSCPDCFIELCQTCLDDIRKNQQENEGVVDDGAEE